MQEHSRAEIFMKLALSLAETAALYDEVPVGAVVTQGDRIISTGFNRRENKQSPIAHAEIIAIEKAAKTLGRWRLYDCWLYVTLEPCIMCSGALWQSRIKGVSFGATDKKGGGLGGAIDIQAVKCLNHKYQVNQGLFQEEAGYILKTFFKSKRNKA